MIDNITITAVSRIPRCNKGHFQVKQHSEPKKHHSSQIPAPHAANASTAPSTRAEST